MKYLLTQKIGNEWLPIAVSKDLDKLKAYNGYCVVSEWTPIELGYISLVTETITKWKSGQRYRIRQVVDMDA